MDEERHETQQPEGTRDRVRLPEVEEGLADLDEESYRRLRGKRRQRLLRQRIVFGLVVLLVLAAGGAAALMWSGRWDPGAGPSGTAATAPACPPPAQVALLPPAEVSVEVLNGTGRRGLAAEVATELRGREFVVSRVANAPVAAGPVTATIAYPAASLPQARTVAARVPEAVLAEDPAATAVTVALGDGYRKLLAEDALAVPVAAPAPGC